MNTKELTVVKLVDLEINNFKGIKHFELKNLNPDVTDIFGANESGKTTIFDAWAWLLTGKNSSDKEDFNIKNTVDISLNRLPHDVAATITVNDSPVKLRKFLVENWVRPRGQTEDVYKGNITNYEVNGVAVQANYYVKYISDFLGEGYIKMLTNPHYFNKLKWSDQRNVLFEMAGNISDKDIAAINPNFTSLYNSLENRSIEVYKKEIAAKKKPIKENLEKIPTRIEEVKLNMPEEVDYTAFEKQIEEKDLKIKDLENEIREKSSAFNTENTKANERQKKVNNITSEISTIQFDIRTEHTSKVNAYQTSLNVLKNNVIKIESDISSKKNLISSKEQVIENLNTYKKQTLDNWHKINGDHLIIDNDEFVCPSCKREFETDDIEAKKTELSTNFNNSKIKKLNDLSNTGKKYVSDINAETLLLDNIKKALETLNKELLAARKELEEALSKPKTEKSLDELYSESGNLQAKLTELESAKAEIVAIEKLDVSELNSQISALRTEINELNKKTALKGEREKALKRVQELEAQQKTLSQEIADLEKIEFTIDAFNKSKVEETEKRINGMFKSVTFKMYDYTVDGSPIETCQTLYKGVPYSDLNTAAKIWAGIDIINALSDFYGVKAPIFLDNRESTTEIPDTESQIINLIVSPSDYKGLRVV